MLSETELEFGVGVVLASPEVYIALTRVHRLLEGARVIILRDLGVISTGSERISVRRGDEVSLPLWLALELQRAGQAELRDAALRDVDLLKYQHMERTTKGSKLAEVRENIYFSAGLTLSLLSKEKDIEHLSKADKFRNTLVNLLELRLGKLVDAAVKLGGRPASEVSKVLEEMVLYRIVRRVLDSWRNSVLRYVE